MKIYLKNSPLYINSLCLVSGNDQAFVFILFASCPSSKSLSTYLRQYRHTNPTLSQHLRSVAFSFSRIDICFLFCNITKYVTKGQYWYLFVLYIILLVNQLGVSQPSTVFLFLKQSNIYVGLDAIRWIYWYQPFLTNFLSSRSSSALKKPFPTNENTNKKKSL